MTVAPILVVDRSADWLEHVARFLSDEGLEIVTCGTGQELRAIFDRTDPSLVIIGSKISDATPIALSRWIRARGGTAIMVFDERNDIGSASLLESGADVVVEVGVGRNEIVARVRALLRRVPPRSRFDEVLGYGGLKLNRVDQVLDLEEGSLQLEGRLFSLMEALMIRGSSVLPRHDIQDVLAVGDAELDGHVRRLRNQLEEIEGWRRIVTVRGVGLRLLEDPSAAFDGI
jgi:DNA-binding response OmpR family regulator